MMHVFCYLKDLMELGLRAEEEKLIGWLNEWHLQISGSDAGLGVNGSG